MLQQGVRFSLLRYRYRMQAILLEHLYHLTKFSEKATSNYYCLFTAQLTLCPFQDKSFVLIPMCCDKSLYSYPSYPLLDYTGKRTPLAQFSSDEDFFEIFSASNARNLPLSVMAMWQDPTLLFYQYHTNASTAKTLLVGITCSVCRTTQLRIRTFREDQVTICRSYCSDPIRTREGRRMP